jgi:hypothetical protein
VREYLCDLLRCSCIDKPQMYFTTVTGHRGEPCFLRSALVIPLVKFQKSPKRERQDSYPGNDANEEAPVGYSVTKYTRYTWL